MKQNSKKSCEQSVFKQSITVKYDYEVYFTEDVFALSNDILKNVIKDDLSDSPHRVLFLLEKNVASSLTNITSDICEYADTNRQIINLTADPHIISGGEKLKSRDTISDLCALMAENSLCRHSFVVIIGGGAFLDTVGFAASIVHRGIRQIRIPTTVLAQNDSGVGVKTAVNMHGIKNFLGTFAPPYAVINDFNFLKTLSDRDWIAGVSEAFKVAMIKDEQFFEWLLRNVELLASRDMDTMRYLIRRCAELHLNHIATSGDPFEFGSARPLDFGHWSAHKLEMLTNGDMRHGEAVAVGLLIDTYYAVEKKYTDITVLEKLVVAFRKLGLPLFNDKLMSSSNGEFDIIAGIEEFREHLGGELHITLPLGIGKKIEVNSLDEKVVKQAITHLSSL